MDNQIEAAAEYAVRSAGYNAQHIRQASGAVEGSTILELGPGKDFGLALLLGSMGASVMVADRFLAQWDDAFHPAVYRRIRELWEGPCVLLSEVIDANSHAPIETIAEPAENMRSVKSRSVDIVISTAVLEHVVDTYAVFAELARITKPGGIGIHQIDFRDHRDFSRPLEFLLIPDDEYTANLESRYWDHGNRLRPSETEAIMKAAGFEVTARHVNATTKNEYLQEFIPRLRASPSRYNVTGDILDLGVMFYLRRA